MKHTQRPPHHRIGWLFLAASLLALPAPVAAQRGFGVLEGRVLIAQDARPATEVVVRLEDHRSQTLDLAFANPAGRFRFDRVPLDNDGPVYLVVDQEGFAPLRERIDFRQLRGLHTLYLTPNEPERRSAEPAPGADNPFVVDVGQLTEVPEAARDAYDDGVRDTADGRVQNAIGNFERAVELAPNFYDAWIKLGIASMDSGQLDDAESAFLSARGANPNGTLAPLNLGILRYRQGEDVAAAGQDADASGLFDDALEYLSETVGLNPVSAPAHFYRGTTLYRLGRYPEAESSLLRAVELDPQSQARLTLINVYVRMNRADAALAQAEAFIEAHPEAPERPAIEGVRDQLRAVLGL